MAARLETSSGEAPDVRWRSIAAARANIDDWMTKITPQEGREAQRFQCRADQHRFIVGRALAREMIAAHLDCDPLAFQIVRDSRGKPFVSGYDNVYFSISHSGDIVIAAVTFDKPLGIDVEKHRYDIDVESLGRLVFTDIELSRILLSPPAAQISLFFRQWVFKEALVKALGTGLLKDPKRFQIGPGHEGPDIEYVGEGENDIGGGWHMRTLDVPQGYSASLCVGGRDAARRELILAA